MATMAQVHSHKGVACLQTCHKHCHIGLCSTVRLYVCPLCTKQFLGTLDGKILCLVYYLATAIVTLRRITLGILVGKA